MNAMLPEQSNAKRLNKIIGTQQYMH